MVCETPLSLSLSPSHLFRCQHLDPRGLPGPSPGAGVLRGESLFGRPAGARSPPPAFLRPGRLRGSRCRRLPARDSVQVSDISGPSTPPARARSRSHAPSFCDESLFGAKPQGPAWAAPRMRKEDVAKLHTLLWSPSPAPRNQPGLSPHSRGTPLRAVHPPASAPSYGWRHPRSDACSEGWGAAGRGRSQSVSRLSTTPDRIHLSSGLSTERWKNQSALTTPAAPQGPLMRGRSNSVSGSPVLRNAKAAGGCKPRPPWK
uniref:RBPJ-interacting and tubulin-associated protein 1 n=1 Tax=Malurus cyaneus samueli TaxID=2593467 RepID=A0A8C5TR64_9PASS